MKYLGFLASVLLLTSSVSAAEIPQSVTSSETSPTKPQYEILLHQNVTYVKRGDLNLQADLYQPKGKGPFPAVLMVHGGAWRMGKRNHMRVESFALARRGYVVMNISYRLAPKYKHPAQLEDCEAAVRWMRTNAAAYQIDADRIAGYGYSAGAHLVCLLGTQSNVLANAKIPSTRLQAVIAGGTPCDFSWIPGSVETLVYWLGATRNANPKLYEEVSPLSHVSKDDPPIFFFHGADDLLVPIQSAEKMYAELNKLGVKTQFEKVTGGHILAFLSRQAVPKAIDFLDTVIGTPTVVVLPE